MDEPEKGVPRPPLKQSNHFLKDLPNLVDIHNDDDDNNKIAEGNSIFVATIHLKDNHHFMHTSSTVLQQLAEAFTKNSRQTSFWDSVPESLHNLKVVLNKESFDSLPDQHKWYHTIKLECDPELGFHKVYPMMLEEQAELNVSPYRQSDPPP